VRVSRKPMAADVERRESKALVTYKCREFAKLSTRR